MGERGLDGLFPERRQAAPDRADPPSVAPRGRRLGLSRLAVRGVLSARSAISPRCCRCFCPKAWAAKRFRSTSGCASGCCRFPRSPRKSVTRGSSDGSSELPTDERLAFFKLITGELRVGVSRLQVVKALAEVAGVDEGRMAQRLIGYSQARRIPTAADFEALIGEVAACGSAGARRGQALSVLSRAIVEPAARRDAAQRLGRPSNWIVEWKYDGIRAQLLKRGENWRLWSRGEELISDAYPDLEPLARALPSGTAIDGELVVLIPPEHDYATDSLDGLAIFASLQQRLGRKIVSEKTMRELPVAFIAYDLLESEGRDLRAEPQHVRRALLEAARRSPVRRGEGARRAPADPHQPDRLRRHLGGAGGEARAGARALPRGADAEGARGRLWRRPPQGRRPHRRVVEMEARPDERRRRA